MSRWQILGLLGMVCGTLGLIGCESDGQGPITDDGTTSEPGLADFGDRVNPGDADRGTTASTSDPGSQPRDGRPGSDTTPGATGDPADTVTPPGGDDPASTDDRTDDPTDAPPIDWTGDDPPADDTPADDPPADDPPADDTPADDPPADDPPADDPPADDPPKDVPPIDDPTLGDVGDACPESTACAGDALAMCIPNELSTGEPGFPDGYCTVACDAAECPEGSGCYDLGNELVLCLDSCAADTDCRSQYICAEFGACWPSCETFGCPDGLVCAANGHCEATVVDDPPVGGTVGAVGDACLADAECQGDAAAACLPEPDFPGGYCSQLCDTLSCPSGSACFDFGDYALCLDSCAADAECRSEYVCVGGQACFPSCAHLGCPAGQTCGADGHCAEGTTPPVGRRRWRGRGLCRRR